MNDEPSGIYSLDELIDALKFIKDNDGGPLNIPKALYCLVNEIEKLSAYQIFLHEIIPLKYKKAFPKKGENPFFSSRDFKLPENKEEIENAKKKMKEYFEKSKQDSSGASSNS